MFILRFYTVVRNFSSRSLKNQKLREKSGNYIFFERKKAMFEIFKLHHFFLNPLKTNTIIANLHQGYFEVRVVIAFETKSS